MTGSEADGELDAALRGLRDLLRADGYDLEVADADATALVLAIHAGPEACADCLAPKSMMELYVRDALGALPRWRDAAIELRYPGPGAVTRG